MLCSLFLYGQSTCVDLIKVQNKTKNVKIRIVHFNFDDLVIVKIFINFFFQMGNSLNYALQSNENLLIY